MSPRRLSVSVSVALLVACSGPPEPPPQAASGPPESSEVSFQAVDAGTGGTLADRELTVRYLVRSPITLDASAVERVSSAESYRVAHEVSSESLVLEVRLEADSYYRLDTVLTVARGAKAGPLTLRMARRLRRAAQASRPGTGSATPSRPATVVPAQPTPTPSGNSDTNVDRSALLAGNLAFRRQDWPAATNAYSNMPAPRNESSDYAREYQQAMARRGTAHVNLGEFGGALEAFELATGFGDPGFRAFLGLGQAQCAVGRIEEGRGTIATLGRRVSRLPVGDRPLVTALVEYQRGLCSQGEFDLADGTMERVRKGARAIRELEGFIKLGEAMSSAPPEVQTAIDDAQRRIARMQARIRG